MSVEDELRALPAPDPPGLVPPPDLADTVLHGLRRRRRRTALAAVAVLAAAVAVPVSLRTGGPDGIPAAAGPSATAPEPPTRLTGLPGGRLTITAFTLAGTGRTSLLDPSTGRYVEMPYEAALLSPDQKTVAVYDGSRVGLVARDALLRDDTDEIVWTGLVGTAPAWSPDGTAVLCTRVEKDPTLVFVIDRWDVAAGRVTTSTRLPDPDAGYPVWAANSRDYLVPRGTDDGGAFRPTGMQLLAPDGTPGPLWAGPAGQVAYSPDRRRATVDPSVLMTDGPLEAGVVDVRTGDQVATLGAGPPVVGWYGRDTVVRLLDAPQLQVVDVRDGSVVRTVRLPGVPPLSGVQLGRATGKAPRF